MYEQVKSKALDLIKEAKEKNEFVSTKIINELKKEFDKVPSDQTIRNRARDIKDKIDSLEIESEEKISKEFKAAKIQTAEEICEERGIDLNKWKMVKIRVGKHSVPIKDDYNEKIITVEAPNIQVTLKRWHIQEDKEATLRAIAELSEETAREHKEYTENNKDKTAVINPADLHMGKIAYDFISGDEYNISIAKQRLRSKLDQTISKLRLGGTPGKFIFIIGNDGLNVDGPKNTTTKGTDQQLDGMYKNSKKELIKLRLYVIELLNRQAPLHIINVSGNHDEESSISIYNTIRARYNSNENISFNEKAPFDEEPIANCQKRQSYKHGDTLLVFNHGEKYQSATKRKEAPNHIRTRFAHLIDENTKIYAMFGHLHKKMKYTEQVVDTKQGVTMFWMPSLCGTDKRHDDSNYVGNPKSLETLVFDKNKGLTDTITATV